jgi:hypothetical protein
MHASNLVRPEPQKKESSPVSQTDSKSNSTRELIGKYKPSVELSEKDAKYKTPIENKFPRGRAARY